MLTRQISSLTAPLPPQTPAAALPTISNGWYTSSAIPTQPPPPPLGWWESARKHRAQANSIAGGLLLIASGGLHVAFSVWVPVIGTNASDIISLMPLVVLHVAAMAGSCLGASLVLHWRTRVIYYLCAMLHIIGNVLLIGLYFSVWALLGGRLLIGLAHGICYVCLVQHAGDNAAKEVRGRSLGNIGIMLTLAICVCVANATVDPYIAASVYGDATARLAMSALAFACLGGLLVRLLCEESVLRLILQQQGAAETDETLMRLRGERQVTRAVYEELLELKQMVADETRLSSLIHMNGNVRPLVLLCGLRMLQFCTNNVLLNSVVLDLPTEVYVAAPVTGVIGLDDSSSILPTALIFAPLLVVTVRLIFAAAAALAADNVRRRWMLMPAGCGGGAILLGMAVLLTLVGAGRLEDRSGYAGLYVLLFAGVQALYGWSADAVPHIVAAEAFGVNKKAWSVAFACSVEQALHAVTLGLSGALLPDVRVPEVRVSDVHMGLMYAFGVLTLALVGALFVQMPSAAGGLSLAQCRQKWRGAGGGVVYSRAYLGNLQREQAYKISVY